MLPQGKRRNRTGPNLQPWHQLFDDSCHDLAGAAPPPEPEVWRSIHVPATARVPRLPGAGDTTSSPDPQRRREASLDTTTTQGRRGSKPPPSSSDNLTPELSGRTAAQRSGSVSDRHWHFIHGRSARTIVRTVPRIQSSSVIEAADWPPVQPRQNAPARSAAQPHGF
jgi:hypothetical protein